MSPVRPRLDDAAEYITATAMTDMLHDRQIMGDEEIG
jgi:hypothetical protein